MASFENNKEYVIAKKIEKQPIDKQVSIMDMVHYTSIT